MKIISINIWLTFLLMAGSNLFENSYRREPTNKNESVQIFRDTISGIFKITRIIKFKSAYFIHADDTTNKIVYAIISPKSNKGSGVRIKVGNSYYFVLKYYYKRDVNAIYIGNPHDEYFQIENEIVHIRNRSPSREIVTTNYLNGLNYQKPIY